MDARYIVKWLIYGSVIGVVAGTASLALFYGIKFFTWLFLGLLVGMAPPEAPGEGEPIYDPPDNPLLLPLVLALGGLISGAIVYTFAPEAEGHGTDAAIRAFHRAGGVIRPVVPIVKLVASAITIGSGGSAGREGPIALTAAGIGSAIGGLLRLSPRDRRIALAAGIGAGVGSIFKAPIGGALLAAEILYMRDMEVEAIIPAIIASVVGYSIFASVTGFGHIFQVPDYSFRDPTQLVFYAALGAAAGLIGIAYAKAFYGTMRLFSRLRIPNAAKPAIGMGLTGLIGIAFPQVLGAGYGWIHMAMTGELGPAWLLAALVAAKIAATSLTVGSGGSGGVFAPALFIGAMLGAAMWHAFSQIPWFHEPIHAFVVVGMMALFGGIGKAPISTTIMVAEMTGAFELLPAAITSVAISYLVTGRYTIYESKVETRLDSPAHRGELLAELARIPVRQVMRVVPGVAEDAPIEEARREMLRSGLRALPVVRDGKLVGVVALEDVLRVGEPSTKVSAVMNRSPVSVRPGDPVSRALQLMTRFEVSMIPVVDDSGRVLGVVTRRDILTLYAEMPEAQI